ncbi:hypothetical protein [Streptomyces tagetis]|uniref:hypothetical protein n=1 Tax=Streptomyces tagetis TaxID=2820809 RepID=UPI0027DBCD57|nr:hypothetical protein [Streptomyces sp. RG38]
MAVSALAGCTTVQPPSGSPSGSGTRTTAPRPDGSAEPWPVQASALEALEGTGHSPAAKRTTAPAAPPGREASAAVPQPRAPRSPAPQNQGGAAPAPGATLPALPRQGGGSADLCALGKRFGGWQPDSPEAVICDRAYGH